MSTTPDTTTHRSLNLPTARADYAGLTRGPLRAWWRPLLSALLMLGIFAVCSGLLVLLMLVFTLARGLPMESFTDPLDVTRSGALALLVNNVWLASLIPAAILATALAHRIPRGFVCSVTGGFRWAWFARITLCLLPVFLLSVGTVRALNFTGVHPDPGWGWFILVALLTTPLQAAGEEFAFRGWPLQNLGGWFRGPRLRWLIPGLLSTGMFAVLHRSTDPWVLLDLGVFSVSALVMVWRTGGIEAAIAMHAVSNTVVMCSGAVLGGLRGSFISQETTASWDVLLVSVITQALCLVVVFWAAGRFGIQRLNTARPMESGRDEGVRLGELPG